MTALNSFSIAFALILGLIKADSDWDFFTFTQTWPGTTCILWKESKGSHFCDFPRDPSHWTIHGLWPTKKGTEGPGFCTHVSFNESALLPIEDELEEEWTNVEMPRDHYSFWKHEWLKHGSCATSVPQLDSEIKYFTQALSLQRKFKLDAMLLENAVAPGDKPYSVEHIQNSVYSALKKIPEVHCLYSKASDKTLVSEIRICMDKNFNVIDCVAPGEKSTFDCGSDPREEIVYYPVEVPKVRYFSPPAPSHHWLYKALYILRLLSWFSLTL